jgi:hypothetical protein
MEAIKRLETLENVIKKIKEEKAASKEFYPKRMGVNRINDSIIMSLDLPNILIPKIGDQVRNGFSGLELKKYFDIDQCKNEEEALEKYNRKIKNNIKELILFIGIIARTHESIIANEKQHAYPGVKTIISSGFRKPFKINGNEDYLSANFAYSNSFIADGSLHGAKFYIDSNIVKMLIENEYCKNMIQRSKFVRESAVIDIFKERKVALEDARVTRECIEKNVQLFRKEYCYMEMNSHYLCFLQLIPKLEVYLGKSEKYKNDTIFRTVFDMMKNKPDVELLKQDKEKFIFWTFNYDDDIDIEYEFIKNGHSDKYEKESNNKL